MPSMRSLEVYQPSSMDNESEQLVQVRSTSNRKWKIIGMIVTVICFISYIILAVWFFKFFYQASDSIVNATTNKNNYMTSTNASDLAITSDNIANSVENTTRVLTSTEPSITSTMTVNPAEKYVHYVLPNSVEYVMSSGRSLGNVLYYNTDQYCKYNGYVSSVSLRLFTNWKDNVPLYLFIIAFGRTGLGIARRHVIEPQRNTTAWQTIKISSHALPIVFGNLLAIGMQDSSDINQIFTVKSVMSMFATNIHENTSAVYPQVSSGSSGVAFGYTVAYLDGSTTTQGH